MSIEYKWSEDDAECQSCNSCVPLAEFSSYTEKGLPTVRRLCEFCSYTLAGTHTRHTARDEHGQIVAEIWRAAANVYNMLTHKAERERMNARGE